MWFKNLFRKTEENVDFTHLCKSLELYYTQQQICFPRNIPNILKNTF